MLRTPFNLAGARILISNDDGIHAPGIKVLEEIARTLSDDVWVIAPEAEQSAQSHSLTIRHPLRIRAIDERHYAIDGTPTDSVLMGVSQVLSERRPDLVLSGINRGGNLAEDIIYSGTVAAAMEAALLGVPAIAFSQVTPRNETPQWDTPRRFLGDIVRKLVAVDWADGVLVNVNFPPIAADQVIGVEVQPQGKRTVGLGVEGRPDPYGVPYYWVVDYASDAPRRRDTDLSAIGANAISVTPLHLDFTHHPSVQAFRTLFA
jgi:5'-nucleotidase